jgi:signal transduction histidine kinase
MFTPFSAANDDFPDLNVLHYLPLPLIVLSSQRTVLIATEAVKRLLAWSPGQQWHPRSLVGCPLAQLGISLSPDQDRDEQDLNRVLDEMACMTTNAAASSAQHSEPTRDRKRQKIKEQDTDMLPTVGDAVYEAWPEDDWCGTPVLEVLVDLQRGHQGRRLVRAKLSVRMWVTGEALFYVLVFAKPTRSANPDQWLNPSQMSEKDARKAKKLATLAAMKSAVFDQASIPIGLLSADETMYYPNQAGLALNGRLEEDYMLENGYQILADLIIWDESFTRKLEVDEYPSIKLVRTRQSFKKYKCGATYPNTGRRVRLDLSGDCLYDKVTGDFLGGAVWCRDVTEYTEVIAQQQLEIERGFESKLDNMPNLSWTARPDGEPDYFSKRWYDYTGANRLDTFKDIWTRTVHPDERDAMWDSWIQCTLNGQPFTREARYKRFDGMYRYQLVHGEPQLDERGNIVRWHGMCTDIHDLVMRRLDASRLKQQMIAVLSHAEVNFFGFNPQMEVTMLEGSIKWGTQESASEKKALVGRELVDIVEKTTNDGATGAADFIEVVQKVLRGDSTMEILEHTVDERWYKTRIMADVDTGEEGGHGTIRGALGLSIDVTDVKLRMALEMEKAQLIASELAAKEANMLKSQFLANVSHELRTPISGVLGMADLLLETPLADEQREYTRGISQSADNLLCLVNDILDASKIEAGRFDIESVEFDLSGVVEDLYKMMTYVAQGKGLTLEYKTSLAPIERVIGDPRRTRQILLNLLTNAVKFTNKGTVILSVSTSESEDTLTVVFTVEDTGIGIEDAVLRKLFRPFSQGDSSTARLFGGTGLGLTICKEVRFAVIQWFGPVVLT